MRNVLTKKGVYVNHSVNVLTKPLECATFNIPRLRNKLTRLKILVLNIRIKPQKSRQSILNSSCSTPRHPQTIRAEPIFWFRLVRQLHRKFSLYFKTKHPLKLGIHFQTASTLSKTHYLTKFRAFNPFSSNPTNFVSVLITIASLILV